MLGAALPPCQLDGALLEKKVWGVTSLDRLAVAAEEMQGLTRQVWVQHRWMPRPKSPVGLEFGRTDLGTKQPVRDLDASVLFGLIVATDKLQGLARSIHPDARQYAAASLARGTLESVSAAGWLLDPEIGSAERLARGISRKRYNIDRTPADLAADRRYRRGAPRRSST